MAAYDFSGIWLSTFKYTSSSRPGEFECRHYSKIHSIGNDLVIESLPGGYSYRLTRLKLDGRVATGTWEQQNAQDGYYNGARYHGAIQLILTEDGKVMKGKWIGFNKNMEVNSGPWEIHYVGESLPEGAVIAEDTGDPYPPKD